MHGDSFPSASYLHTVKSIKLFVSNVQCVVLIQVVVVEEEECSDGEDAARVGATASSAVNIINTPLRGSGDGEDAASSEDGDGSATPARFGWRLAPTPKAASDSPRKESTPTASPALSPIRFGVQPPAAYVFGVQPDSYQPATTEPPASEALPSSASAVMSLPEADKPSASPVPPSAAASIRFGVQLPAVYMFGVQPDNRQPAVEVAHLTVSAVPIADMAWNEFINAPRSEEEDGDDVPHLFGWKLTPSRQRPCGQSVPAGAGLAWSVLSGTAPDDHSDLRLPEASALANERLPWEDDDEQPEGQKDQPALHMERAPGLAGAGEASAASSTSGSASPAPSSSQPPSPVQLLTQHDQLGISGLEDDVSSVGSYATDDLLQYTPHCMAIELPDSEAGEGSLQLPSHQLDQQPRGASGGSDQERRVQYSSTMFPGDDGADAEDEGRNMFTVHGATATGLQATGDEEAVWGHEEAAYALGLLVDPITGITTVVHQGVAPSYRPSPLTPDNDDDSLGPDDGQFMFGHGRGMVGREEQLLRRPQHSLPGESMLVMPDSSVLVGAAGMHESEPAMQPDEERRGYR